MAKFPRKPKLNKAQTQDLIIDFCEAIAATKNGSESAQLLTDLLGKQELEMLARRLKVAEMLLDDNTYEQIGKALKISKTTIARVQSWLQNSGEGYRLVIERTKKNRPSSSQPTDPLSFSRLKRKYPLYFWPQLAMEYWANNSSKKHKEQMQKLLSKIEDKPKMYKDLEIILRQNNLKKVL